MSILIYTYAFISIGFCLLHCPLFLHAGAHLSGPSLGRFYRLSCSLADKRKKFW